MKFSWNATPAAIRTGLVAAILGFVVSCSSSSTRRVNGAVVECSYFDAGALFAGAVAVVAGVAGLAASRGRKDDKTVMLALSIAIVLVGALHVARGLGLIGGPCN